MSLNLSTIMTLFRTEMRIVLRDRRMVITSIVLPLLVTPLIFLGSNWSVKKHEQQLQQMEYKYAVTGEQIERVRALVSAASEFSASASERTKAVPLRLKEVSPADPQKALRANEIHLILELRNPGTAGARIHGYAATAEPNAASGAQKPPPEMEIEGEKLLPGTPSVLITFRADRHESARAMSRLREALEETRSDQRFQLLQERGFPIEPAEVASITLVDVASKRQVAGLALGRFLTLLLLFFILSSGAVVAMDSLAGEKERGTLETLLTTSARRLEILAGKQLVIVAVALVITTIQLGNLVLYVGLKLLPVPANLAAAITPQAIVLLFLLYVPVAALAANILLLVSGFSRTYKEAQMYFLPVLLLGLVPSLAPMLPGIPLRSAIVLVPVANIAIAAKEVLVGSYDWLMIFLSWLTTSLTAIWTARIGVRALLQEKLIMGGESDPVEITGGPALFPKRVLRWFAVLWGLLLIVSSYTETFDLRLQVGINLVGLFFGASCLMAWRYKLSAREAFSLHLPRPAVWVGIIAAVPGGFLTALGLFQLANRLVPAPSSMIETFTGALFPAHIPFYQVLFFLTVLPGFCEELTFRGVLLHGLRRRTHPAIAALISGVIFGIFHVALFRLVPTAALGVMFGLVTVLTGSIFPAMLWHTLNNAMGLLAYKLRFPESGLETSSYLMGVALLAVAFYVFWRNRMPGPHSSAVAEAASKD